MVYSYIQQHGLVPVGTVIDPIFCFQKKTVIVCVFITQDNSQKQQTNTCFIQSEHHMVSITKPASCNHAYNSSLHGEIICGKSIWVIFLCCMWLCIMHRLHCAKIIFNICLWTLFDALIIGVFWSMSKNLWHFLLCIAHSYWYTAKFGSKSVNTI